jgi:hypothetical protein
MYIVIYFISIYFMRLERNAFPFIHLYDFNIVVIHARERIQFLNHSINRYIK